MIFKSEHIPVLVRETIEGLKIRPEGIYVDGTFGRGGHSKEIMKFLGTTGQLIAFDKDIEAVEYGKELFKSDSRFSIVHSSFSEMLNVLREKNLVGGVHGILLDLGVSGPQLDDPNRGFSFMKNGPLDMRMNQGTGISAKDWIDSASEKEIYWVIKEFGEEKQAKKIARKIVEMRLNHEITTTKQLSEICEKILKPRRLLGKHPATRVFQAIRIWINHELDDLKKGLQQTLDVLAVHGRLAVISFHSMEDRIVKFFMREQSITSYPSKLPIIASELKTSLKLVSSAIKPTEEEIRINPRARSAILRIAEKLA